MGGGRDVSVGHEGCQDTMEAAWVGHGGGQSKGACGGGLRAGVWGAGHQRVGCGRLSEHSDLLVHIRGWGGASGLHGDMDTECASPQATLSGLWIVGCGWSVGGH